MLDLMVADFMKLRKNKMLWILTAVVWGVPVLLVLKELFILSASGYEGWFVTLNMISSMTLSVMSGLLITFLIQREYQDHTIINTLTSPVSRRTFIIEKFLIWALWNLIAAMGIGVIAIIGYKILFPEQFLIENMGTPIIFISKSCIFGFCSLSPVLFAAIKQKMLFYPSLLLTLLFTVIGVSAWQTSEEMLTAASIVPWSAASIGAMLDTSNPYFYLAVCSVLICMAVGVVISVYSFSKQDQ